VLLLYAGPAFAQAPSTRERTQEVASRETPATFSSKVNLVNVPVVVRDSKGQAIGNLKKEDFQLFDKGKLQVISRFAIEKADGRVVPVAMTTADPDAKNPAKPEEGPPPASRFVAYLFDDLHTSFGDLAQARNAAVKHLAASMQGPDRAAVYTTSGQTMLDFTDDQEKLRETMNRIVPRSRQIAGPSQCPDISDYMADLIVNKNDPAALGFAARDELSCAPSSNPISALALAQMTPAQQAAEEAPYIAQAKSMAQGVASQVLGIADADAQTALGVLKATVERMGAMPGQRTIVLVSSGFLVTLNHREDEVLVIDRAIRSNVIISALDARGLYTVIPGGDASTSNTSTASASSKARYQAEAATAHADVLGEIADGTGGTFFHNNNDLEEGFRRTAAAPEFMYVLGFAPQNLRLDGSFHALKVTLKDTKGLALQARRGYYAPRHSTTPAEDAKEEIRVALFSRDEMSDIPVELQTQFFKPTDQNARLSVLAHVDLKHLRFKKVEGRNRNVLSIVAAVFDRNGVLVSSVQKDVEMRLKDETFEARLVQGVNMKTSFEVTPGSYVVRLVVRDTEGQSMAARNGVVEIP
jgi:VWFA-related protein